MAGSPITPDVRPKRKQKAKPAEQFGGNFGTQWWKVAQNDGRLLAESCAAAFARVFQAQEQRRRDDGIFTAMYEGQDIQAFLRTFGVPSSVGQSLRGAQTLAALNVTKSVIDTVVANITDTRPKATFSTKNGSWKQQRLMGKCDAFVEGTFYETRMQEELMPRAATDACVLGTGAIKIFAENDRACAERTNVRELYVDRADGFYGNPRQMFQARHVPREVLLENYGDDEDARKAIERAEIDTGEASPGDTISNQVLTLESWHLASSGEANDGRAVIILPSAQFCLSDKPYKRSVGGVQVFPFVWDRWDWKLDGFWGQGICEQGRGLQDNINNTIKRIMECLRRVAVPKYLVEAGSKVNTKFLGNEIGAMIHYVGRPPVIDISNAVPPQLLEWIDKQVERYFSMAGVSQLSAQGLKPPGVTADVAIRTVRDMQTKRFSRFDHAYDQMAVDAAQHFIAVTREIVEETGSYKVIAHGAARRLLEQIDFKTIGSVLKDGEYQINITGTNLLADQPTAKLQGITELMQANVGLTPEEGARLLTGIPDLDAAMSIKNAPYDAVMRVIERISDGETGLEPEPLLLKAVPNAPTMVTGAMFKAQDDGAPEEIIAEFRAWIERAQADIDDAAAAMAPPMQVPAGPQAVPAPAPVSRIMPQGATAA